MQRALPDEGSTSTSRELQGSAAPPEALIRTAAGRITFWSPGLARRYGYSSEVACGRMAHELLQTILPRPPRDIEAVLAERSQWDGPLLQRHMDGRLIITSSSWYLHRNADGESLVTELHHDLTGLNDAVCADVANLLGALSHELSEPLTAITGYLGGMREVLRSPGPDLAGVRAATDAAAKQATRAAEALRLLRHLAATMQRAQ